MVFSSTVFLFLFLPAVLGIYFLTPRRGKNFVLAVSSLVFYTWGGTWFVLVMMFGILSDYCWGLLIATSSWRVWGPVRRLEPGGRRTRLQKMFLVFSITCNLSLLGFFKYFNLGASSYNSMVSALGFPRAVWHDPLYVALPIGISFFTFQSMSYTIDVYMGHVRANRNLLNFATFASLFPQLIAGPIVRYRQIGEQLVNRVHGIEMFTYGVKRFCIGLAKKVLIANTVAVSAEAIFKLPTDQLTAGLAWTGILCYTLQIYFDFSGYSDMAIGIGRMLGFDFLENFDYPYISQSIREFWRRWHISLSTWFRDYLYIPLGGSQRTTARTYANLILVFFLCGLWHGAAWTFAVWGLYHGLFLVLERVGLGRLIARCPAPLRHGYALLVIMVGWVLFRADTFSQAVLFLGAMAGLGHGTGTEQFPALYLNPEVVVAIVIGIVIATPLFKNAWEWLHGIADSLSGAQQRTLENAMALGSSAASLSLLFISSLFLAGQTYNPFIYFRF